VRDAAADPGPAERGGAEEALLVARAAAGDAPAFDDLVRRFKDRVFRLARRFVRSHEDAEEIVQEVFLKVHRSLPGYRAGGPFEHWILRVATNACRDALRRRRRRAEVTVSQIADNPGAWLDAALSGASLDAARAEAARLLATDLLDLLPPKDRIVLVLMDLEGMSAAEVAAATGSTRAAVKVRAMRARRSLRRLAERVPRRRT